MKRRCTRGRAQEKILSRPCLHTSFSLSLRRTTTTHSQTSKQEYWWAITKTAPTDKKSKQSEANSQENGYGLEVHTCSALGAPAKRPHMPRDGVAPMHRKRVPAFSLPPQPFDLAFYLLGV